MFYHHYLTYYDNSSNPMDNTISFNQALSQAPIQKVTLDFLFKVKLMLH